MSLAGPLAAPVAPGSNGLGSLVTGSLEMSNVDLAGQLTQLITTQRAYEANAKVITTSDEILQDLVNLGH
jgi:flagellar hook protein FlgE